MEFVITLKCMVRVFNLQRVMYLTAFLNALLVNFPEFDGFSVRFSRPFHALEDNTFW